MKNLIKSCLFSALLILPLAAAAQDSAAPKADGPKSAAAMMMNCPMMGDMSAMQKDMGGMMAEMQAMMTDTKDPAAKERLQKMHERMTAMMASMQKMGMMGAMMGGGAPGAAQPDKASPAAPASPPASEEDHAAHHPAP